MENRAHIESDDTCAKDPRLWGRQIFHVPSFLEYCIGAMCYCE